MKAYPASFDGKTKRMVMIPNDDPAAEGEAAVRLDNLRAEFKEKITDLSGRLYYCSDTGEGRKMRRWIEREIKRLEAEIEVLDLWEEER